MRRWLPALTLSLGGCLSHMPPDSDPVHLQISWIESFETARNVAMESGKPLLVVMVAGDIVERC